MKGTALCFALIVLLLAGTALGATEETKQLSIDNGLAWLASTQTVSGAEGYWPYANNGTLAATASAALAFIEEGYLPGDGSMYDGVVTKALTYIFNRATVDGRFGPEGTAPNQRYGEDYNNDGVFNDGNNEAIYFNPGDYRRNVYTTGLVSPVIYALGNALGKNTVVGMGSAAISGKTYAQTMQDMVDWFCFAQVEPSQGIFRGGWRYDANWGDADNSTAQWGSLPLLYAKDWGLGTPQYVFDELTLWVNYIQNTSNGGSGYTNPSQMISVSKTGGLLLELAAIGAPAGDSRVLAAVNFINSRWNTGPSGTWYGNLNHPYAMWAVYKGLQVYGYMPLFDCGAVDIRIGTGILAAPGGFNICFDASPSTSAAGDWYSHYCDYLTAIQNANGSWSGYSYWVGALATGWYINILNAVEVPSGPYEVAFDIKPTSCPNPLNLKLFEKPKNSFSRKGGVLPVAILGTEDFDVHDIDVSSVMLEGIAPLRHDYEDVTAPYTGDMDCGCTTDGPDGYMDLTFKFSKALIAGAVAPAYDGNRIPLTITGLLNDGTEFEGVDCVLIRSSVDELPTLALSNEVVLGGATPNPFNPSTTIKYSLPSRGEVSIKVYNMKGMLVRTLVEGVVDAGDHNVIWNGRDAIGSPVATGVYLYKIHTADTDIVKKMALIK